MGGIIWSCTKNYQLYFDNEEGVYMSSGECEENGYGHDLDLLIVLHLFGDLHPKKNGCRA